jgi:CRISPR-associated endonuclease Csy4
MKFYIDITFLPAGDISNRFLWEKVYQQVHIAMVDYKNGGGSLSIAAAFPKYSAKNYDLGDKLRLMSKNESAFSDFNIRERLAKFADYVHLTAAREVPTEISSHVSYSRYAVDSSKKRQIERRMRRHNETEAQAEIHFSGYRSKKVNLPFVYIYSHTTNTRFPLFVSEICSVINVEGGENFDSYGLSSDGHLPFF